MQGRGPKVQSCRMREPADHPPPKRRHGMSCLHQRCLLGHSVKLRSVPVMSSFAGVADRKSINSADAERSVATCNCHRVLDILLDADLMAKAFTPSIAVSDVIFCHNSSFPQAGGSLPLQVSSALRTDVHTACEVVWEDGVRRFPARAFCVWGCTPKRSSCLRSIPGQRQACLLEVVSEFSEGTPDFIWRPYCKVFPKSIGDPV